jgi:POT family proton-dependent oligopeptide transporter
VVCISVFFERWAAMRLGSSVVLMLCHRYGYGRSDALRLAGLLSAASYLATLPAGLAVDRVLGSRRALGAGMALLALGYAVLTQTTPVAIWLSIALLVCGHALFKPSTQAVLARLYEANDARLDAAQIMFYLAVNAGCTVGAVSAGLLMRAQDWRAQFAVASVVMFIGHSLLSLGRNTLLLRPTAWLFACMTLLVIGELLVAPLGLALILRLAPPRFVGAVVGGWYISGALGYWLAGQIGAAWLSWLNGHTAG